MSRFEDLVYCVYCDKYVYPRTHTSSCGDFCPLMEADAGDWLIREEETVDV